MAENMFVVKTVFHRYGIFSGLLHCMLPPPSCPCYGGLYLAKQGSTLQIAIIHPQQPLRHCRAPCQGCNTADADLWYTLPYVLDEPFATQSAARMVIGTFTASRFS